LRRGPCGDTDLGGATDYGVGGNTVEAKGCEWERQHAEESHEARKSFFGALTQTSPRRLTQKGFGLPQPVEIASVPSSKRSMIANVFNNDRAYK
jgi:hypothetical protein